MWNFNMDDHDRVGSRTALCPQHDLTTALCCEFHTAIHLIVNAV